ncbi:MAG: hypothetical protein ACYS47_08380 [Planctomycetota bacterium]
MPEENKGNAQLGTEEASSSEGADRVDPMVSAMKMMGKTTAMATNGLESVARGLYRTLSFALKKSGLADVGSTDAEFQRINRQIDELCLEIGRRIFTIPEQDLVKAMKDERIQELVAGLQACRERIQNLEKEKASAADEPPGAGTAEPEEAKPEGEKRKSKKERNPETDE